MRSITLIVSLSARPQIIQCRMFVVTELGLHDRILLAV